MRRTNEIRALLIAILALTLISASRAIPTGPVIISNSTDSGPSNAGTLVSIPGGTITTYLLNATQQNLRWKAFVGNVTGRYLLQDSYNYSIYDWSLTITSGEVYATRASSVSWGNVNCSTTAQISAEETALNQNSANPDTISKTFSSNTHAAFAVGTVSIPANTCKSTATNVNGQPQSTYFQEVLLHDQASAFIYTALLSVGQTGYNNQKFDFQMIVPEDEITPGNTQYYLYVELI